MVKAKAKKSWEIGMREHGAMVIAKVAGVRTMSQVIAGLKPGRGSNNVKSRSNALKTIMFIIRKIWYLWNMIKTLT